MTDNDSAMNDSQWPSSWSIKPALADVLKRLLVLLLTILVGGWLLPPVIVITAFVQMLFWIFAGSRQPRLLQWSAQLAAFVQQIVNYLLMITNDIPYPFTALPVREEDSAEVVAGAPATSEPINDDNDEPVPPPGGK